MRPSTFKKNVLATNIAILLGSVVSVGAYAADEAAVDENIEKIEVRGMRASNKAAMNEKRFSNAVVDAITAEDIGKFPDKNIAESLQRIAGVSINRGFVGEGAEVSIRGVDPNLTQVQMNGQFVASTAWFSQGSNDRGFNMDLMPSEMIAGLEVYKSPVASLDEGGVGGTVILKTRKPLDLDKNTVYFSAEGNTNTLADSEYGVGGSALYSWKNDEETFGILAMVSSLEQIGRGRKAENYWEEGWSASGIAGFDQDRTRDAFDITAQFQATDDLGFVLHAFRTNVDATNTNQNFLVIGADADSMTNTDGSRIAPNGLPLTGTVNKANWLAQDTNTRRAEMTSSVVDLTFDYQGDGYEVSGTIGKTFADGGNGGNANGLWGQKIDGINGITVDIDMDLQDSMKLVPNGVDLADASWQDFQGGSLARTELEDEEVYAQLDSKILVDWGAVSSIETGVKYRSHDNTYRGFGATLGDTSHITNINQFADGTLSDFDEVVTGGTPTSYVKINGESYWNALNSAVTSWDEQLGNYSKIEEDIFAAYVQGNFDGEYYRGNVGLRYVNTKTTGSAYNGNLTAIDSSDGEYSDFLPSFNLAVDLADDVILRMSAAKVMTRAGYSQLAPGYSGLPSEPPESGRYQTRRGDPGLDPFRATQMDIGLEWYYNESSMLTGAIFSKDIASFISTKTIYEDLVDVPVPGRYEVVVPDQGRGGKIEGLELQWQTSFDNGLGALVNYTYVDAKGQTDNGDSIVLPGSSRNSFNLTGFYESDIFTARLAYTNRSEFFAEGTAIGAGADSFDAQDFLDASVTFHATDFLDISLEGVNLLNEITYQRHSTGAETVRVITDNGSRYTLKAAFRF
ncbi:TonB-dependent receptor [Shewanella gaetbuli]|uniref:TonB-dependent receptor n=1 Tax=Shewanella gaetbuli TaxID=220752 RepID=A0A9X1ZJ28_9GAMM|nr:TonB-dependent receptor [Shewanella gaetbuli]MCL1141882.1 TonB-dependent receptor [Shewanella gaetbuli]